MGFNDGFKYKRTASTWYNPPMLDCVEPETILHRDRVHRVCLFLACTSFIIWLLSSYAISNNIHSFIRLFEKFHNR